MSTRMTTRTTRTPALRSTAVAGVALAALLGLSACGDGGSTTASDGGSSGSSSEIAADAAYNEQDVTFAKDMKPHHEQAVEMADMVLGKSPGPQITALAEKIKAAQEPEIAQLDALLAEFDVDTAGSGGHDMSEGSSMGMGMMSDDDMRALEDATGTQAETLFLEGMLEHHNGAVEMATKEIDAGKYPQAIGLATKIKADQQAEISEMEQLLSKA